MKKNVFYAFMGDDSIDIIIQVNNLLRKHKLRFNMKEQESDSYRSFELVELDDKGYQIV